MRVLGNILFFVFGAFVIFLGYVVGRTLLCLAIVGISFGLQCFMLAGGVLAPFGRILKPLPSEYSHFYTQPDLSET